MLICVGVQGIFVMSFYLWPLVRLGGATHILTPQIHHGTQTWPFRTQKTRVYIIFWRGFILGFKKNSSSRSQQNVLHHIFWWLKSHFCLADSMPPTVNLFGPANFNVDC